MHGLKASFFLILILMLFLNLPVFHIDVTDMYSFYCSPETNINVVSVMSPVRFWRMVSKHGRLDHHGNLHLNLKTFVRCILWVQRELSKFVLLTSWCNDRCIPGALWEMAKPIFWETKSLCSAASSTSVLTILSIFLACPRCLTVDRVARLDIVVMWYSMNIQAKRVPQPFFF